MAPFVKSATIYALCLGFGIAACAAQEVPVGPPAGLPRDDAPMALRTREPGGGYVGNILSAYLSRDGSQALVATTEGTIGVWGAETSWLGSLIGADGDLIQASAVLTDSDSGWILSAGPWMRVADHHASGWEGGILRVWETQFVFERFRFVNDEILEVAAADEAFHYVAMIDGKYRMKLIEIKIDQYIVTKADASLSPPEDLKTDSPLRTGVNAGFSADVHRAIAIATEKDSPGGLLLYDIRAGKVGLRPARAYYDAAKQIPDEGERIGVERAALSADGRIISLRLAGRPDRVELFDFDTNAHVGALALDQGDGVAAMQFDDAGRYLAVATTTGPVRIFSIETSKQEAVGQGPGTGPVWAMRFVENSKLLVLSGAAHEMNRGAYEVAAQVQAQVDYVPKIHLWSITPPPGGVDPPRD